MITMDLDFIDGLGLAELPVEDKRSLLHSAYLELELKVGQALSEGLTSEQLDEFERIIDRDESTVDAVLDRYADFIDDSYLAMERSEAASLVWLREMRPDYQRIVSERLQFIRDEIRAAADRILAEVAHKSHQTTTAMEANDD